MKFLNSIKQFGSQLMAGLHWVGQQLKRAHAIVSKASRVVEFAHDALSTISHAVPALKPAAHQAGSVRQAFKVADTCIANLRVLIAREVDNGPIPQF